MSLKEIRKKQRLSQDELSQNSGVNVRMIQYYEQGVKDVNKAQAETVYKLAQALDCAMEDIIDTNRIEI